MRASVLEWLEEASVKYADKTAACDEWESFTYKQYHDKAVGLADAVIATGIGGKQPIVVYINKSIKVLASFMGIAYSGNFYSPGCSKSSRHFPGAFVLTFSFQPCEDGCIRPEP